MNKDTNKAGAYLENLKLKDSKYFYLRICFDLGTFPQENMGNGISEALKINIFCGSMPPDPPRASRLRRTFH